MTIGQILALILAGPLAAFTGLRAVWSVRFAEAQYSLVDAIVFCITLATILVAFFGIK